MGIRPDAQLARRAALPHDRHDRRRTGGGQADRRATGRRRSGGRPRRSHPGRAHGRRAGRGDRLRDVGTWGHGRGRDPARGGRSGRSRWGTARERAGVRAGARAAATRPRDRHLARRSEPRDQRRAGRGQGQRRADRRHHGQRWLTGRGAGGDHRRDRRARSRLVPHDRLPQPGGGRGDGRRPSVGPSPRPGDGGARPADDLHRDRLRRWRKRHRDRDHHGKRGDRSDSCR